MEKKKTISSRQYGFRAGRTTIDAVLQVIKNAKSAVGDKKFYAVVTLDIKNVFHTMLWQRILENLQKTGT